MTSLHMSKSIKILCCASLEMLSNRIGNPKNETVIDLA